MCGIVGMFGSDIDHNGKKMFKDLLIMDTIRGGDSTGFFGVDGKGMAGAKKAVDGYSFTNMTMYSKQMTSLVLPKLLVGHNRWATQGRVIDQNAHPFSRGDIHMVHNGSLMTNSWDVGQNKLYDANMTDVDSEAICFNIHHEGLEATVSKLDGAFALVVYDDTTKTVSFVRNDERPLYFAYVKNKDLVIYASEAGMIQTAAARNNIVLAGEPWLLNDATILSYDITSFSNVLASEDVSQKIPLFTPPPYRKGKWNSTTYKYDKPSVKKGGNHNPPTKSGLKTSSTVTPLTNPARTSNVIQLGSPTKKRKTHLVDYGIKPKTKMKFVPEVFSPLNSGGITRGALYSNNTQVCGAACFQLTEHQFEKSKGHVLTVQIESVSHLDGGDKDGVVVTTFVRQLSKKQEADFWTEYLSVNVEEVKEVSEADDNFTLFRDSRNNHCDRDTYTKLVKNGCCVCADPIPIDVRTSEYLEYILEQQPLCVMCSKMYGDKSKKNCTTIEDEVMKELGI